MKQRLPSVNHEQFPMQMTHKHNKWLQRRQRGQQETEEQRNRRLEYQRHYDRFTLWKTKSAKFQLCTTARSIIIFMRTALPYLCSVFLFLLNLEAEIMLNVLFNTLLKVTPHNTQKKNKKKRKNNVWTFTTIFAVGHPSSSFNPDRQGLT